MKNILLLILILQCWNIQGQDITVNSYMNKELSIENIEYSLRLFTFEDEKMLERVQVEHLTEERLVEKLDEIDISYEKEKHNESDFIPSIYYSSFKISSIDEESLNLLSLYIHAYSNCEFELYSYDILDEDENMKKIFNEALNEAKVKASTIAKQMNRKLGELKHVKLVNEHDGGKVLDINLNRTIGWGWEPSSPFSSREGAMDVKEDQSITISKTYEFTFGTE